MDLIQESKSGCKFYQIQFPTGEIVIFKLLSWGDFKVYGSLMIRNTASKSALEDAVARQCIINYPLIEAFAERYAGILTTVVGLIMAMSGPTNVEGFNTAMDMARNGINSLDAQIIMVICRAFPAYTPEDLEKLRWEDVMVRLAQAENILMSKQPPEIAQPLRLMTPGETQAAQKGQRIDVDRLVAESEAMRMAMPPQRGGEDDEITEQRRDTTQRRTQLIRERLRR